MTVFTNRISKMQLVLFPHKSWIRRSPFYSESTAIPSGLLGKLYPTCKAFPLCMEQTGWIRGLLRTFVGVRAFLTKSATPSCSFMWWYVTRLSFLNSIACEIKNPTPNPLQWHGRSGGPMIYWRNMESLQSCVPSSFLFTVYGTTEIHSPVFCPRRRWQHYFGETSSASSERSSPASCDFRHRISAWTLVRSCVWLPDWNLTRPRRAATMFPVTMQDVV